jgi:hypothetical protein
LGCVVITVGHRIISRVMGRRSVGHRVLRRIWRWWRRWLDGWEIPLWPHRFIRLGSRYRSWGRPISETGHCSNKLDYCINKFHRHFFFIFKCLKNRNSNRRKEEQAKMETQSNSSHQDGESIVIQNFLRVCRIWFLRGADRKPYKEVPSTITLIIKIFFLFCFTLLQ